MMMLFGILCFLFFICLNYLLAVTAVTTIFWVKKSLGKEHWFGDIVVLIIFLVINPIVCFGSAFISATINNTFLIMENSYGNQVFFMLFGFVLYGALFLYIDISKKKVAKYY